MKTLNRLYGKIPGYDVEEEYEILAATIKAEEAWASANREIEWQAIFRGVNGVGVFRPRSTMEMLMVPSGGHLYQHGRLQPLPLLGNLSWARKSSGLMSVNHSRYLDIPSTSSKLRARLTLSPTLVSLPD